MKRTVRIVGGEMDGKTVTLDRLYPRFTVPKAKCVSPVEWPHNPDDISLAYEREMYVLDWDGETEPVYRLLA